MLFLGENDTYFDAQDVVLDADLAALGSTLHLGADTLDGGNFQATGSFIANAPLTAGVTTLTYNDVDSVSGGEALFSTTNGTPFVASESNTTPVPEPTSLALMLASLAGCAALGRRRTAPRRGA